MPSNRLPKQCDVRGLVLNWFYSFLKYRYQTVRIDNFISDSLIVIPGPQRSVLASLLLGLYLKPLADNITNFGFSHHSYARRCAIYVSVRKDQRWSRRHKARGQGQGHKKNPRPRTAFPRTDTLEAKGRNARGQGQGPRTQAQVLSKKKGLHKNFSGDLRKKTFSKKFFKRSTKF